MEQYMAQNSGGFDNETPFITSEDGILEIPEYYRDLYVDYDVSSLAPTTENREYLRQIYIQSFYMNHWYTKECDIFTAPTTFYPISLEKEVIFETPMFARLNSVSPKCYKRPVRSLSEAKNQIEASSRCQAVLNISRHHKFHACYAIRHFQDFSQGVEYRLFVRKERLTAISSNDDRLTNFDNTELIARSRELLKMCIFFMPFSDCVIDIFIHDTLPELDQVVEFNSFGSWANAGSGLFHWLEDAFELNTSHEVTVRVFR